MSNSLHFITILVITNIIPKNVMSGIFFRLLKNLELNNQISNYIYIQIYILHFINVDPDITYLSRFSF